MDESQLDDLKQFIAAMISQTEEKLNGEIAKLRSEMTTGFASLRSEMLDGFAGVCDAIASIHDHLDERDTEVDIRLTKLERRAA